MSTSPATPVRATRDGPVTVLTLDRPDKLNAFDAAQTAALGRELGVAADDPAVRAVVVTGAGRAFSAGADIAEFGALVDGVAFRAFITTLEGVFAQIELIPKPVIAAVHGLALGGGFELALACDLRIADESARLGLPEIALGLLPGAAGTQRILRIVPRSTALRLLVTGDQLTAADALRHGFVDEVVPAGGALDAAIALAHRLAAGPAAAIATAKRLVREGAELPLRSGIALERELVSALFDTADRAEGVRAFLERRPAVFPGG